MRSILIVGVLAGLAAPAHAQRVEYVAKFTASYLSGLHMHALGPRYIAMSGLHYGDGSPSAEVLDLTTQKIIVVRSTRAAMLGHFGPPSVGPEAVVPGAGELVSFDGLRAGLWLTDDDDRSQPTDWRRAPSGPRIPARRLHWYAELDAKTGSVVRSAQVSTTDDTQEIYFLGNDVQRDAAWFYVEQYTETRGMRTNGPRSVTFRRLDLKTLAMTDEVTVPLAGRPLKSYEDVVMVHHARDFSRFALVEYDEDELETSPATKVYLIDPTNGATFAVPAMDTTYGVAFTRGKYVYLASCRGRIARVDLVKRKIDKYVAGPVNAHNVIESPNGSQLFVLATSGKFTVYDVPGLANRRDPLHKHAAVAGAAEQLFGGGVGSLDGTYFVMHAARPVASSVTHSSPTPEEWVLVKLVD